MLLTIAGVTTAVAADEAGPALRVQGATRRFLASDATPDVAVRVEWANLSEARVGKPVFDAGALWQLHREGDAFLFRFTTRTLGPVPYREALFDSGFTAGKVRLHRPYFEGRGPVDPLEYPLAELLFINHLHVQRKGVVVHGCGVVDRAGAGYLFAGPSGAGKTTMARLWEAQPGVTVLSDDRVVLRPDGGEVWMYGTPWHGDARLASPAKVRLSGVFFLQAHAEHRLTRLERAQATARLFTCSFPPFYSATGLAFTLAGLDAVTEAVPCTELGFVPDATVVDFVRRQAELSRRRTLTDSSSRLKMERPPPTPAVPGDLGRSNT